MVFLMGEFDYVCGNYAEEVLSLLDVKKKDKKKACEKIAEICLRASYTIYLCRNNNVWTDDWELVKRPS